MVAHSDGSAARVVTNVADGVRSVLLSGDAHYLYVVEGNSYIVIQSRIQRFDLTTGAIVDIPAVQ